MASRKTSSGDLAMDVLRAEQEMWEKQRQELENPAKSAHLHSKDLHVLWIVCVQYGFGHMKDDQQFRNDSLHLCDSLRKTVHKLKVFKEKGRDFVTAYLYTLHGSEDLELEVAEALKQKKLAERARGRQQKKDQARVHEVENKRRIFKGRGVWI